jgi:hypothetical protein
MRLEDYVWCQDNHGILYQGHSVRTPEKIKIYEIYNAITGEQKRPNGCGKCLTNTLKRVRFEYEKYQDKYED